VVWKTEKYATDGKRWPQDVGGGGGLGNRESSFAGLRTNAQAGVVGTPSAGKLRESDVRKKPAPWGQCSVSSLSRSRDLEDREKGRGGKGGGSA